MIYKKLGHISSEKNKKSAFVKTLVSILYLLAMVFFIAAFCIAGKLNMQQKYIITAFWCLSYLILLYCSFDVEYAKKVWIDYLAKYSVPAFIFTFIFPFLQVYYNCFTVTDCVFIVIGVFLFLEDIIFWTSLARCIPKVFKLYDCVSSTVLLIALFLFAVAICYEIEILFYVTGAITILCYLANFYEIIATSEVFSAKAVHPTMFFASVRIVLAIAVIIGILIKLPKDIAGIVTPVVASIMGGAITFGGVLLTINYNNRERRRAELLKLKPFLVYHNSFGYIDVNSIQKFSVVSLSPNMLLGDNNTYILDHLFVVRNVSKNACVLSYIKINDKKFYDQPRVFLPNENVLINASAHGNVFYFSEEINSISLGVYDLNYNLYEYDVHFSKSIIHINNVKREDYACDYILDANNVVHARHIDCDFIDCSSEKIGSGLKKSVEVEQD